MHRAICIIAVLAVCLVWYLPAEAQERLTPPGGGPGSSSFPAQDADYRFGPEDVLHIQVWGKPELSGTVTVDYAGSIQIPLVGDVPASGRTPGDLGEDLTERFQLLDPSVSEVVVWVVGYRSQSVTIVGEVRSPGPYGFREMPDLWEAILTAGGPTGKAELALVQVIREAPGLGRPQTITVDLSRGIDETPVESLPELQPLDLILVPSMEDATIGGDKINVLGEVRAPGVLRIAAARDVVEALTVSGGFGTAADLKHVYLTRVDENGVKAYELNIKDYLEKGTPMSNLELQPGDTITVPQKTSWFIQLTDGFSRLLPFASLAVAFILATN